MSEQLAEAPIAGEAVDAGAAEEAAAAEETPVVAAPAESFSRDDLEAELEARLAPIAHYMPLLEQIAQAASAPPAGQQADAVAPPDPYSETYAQDFAAFLQQRDEQMFGRFEQMINGLAQPLQAREQAETVAEGEQRLKDMVADDISRNGDLPAKAQAAIRPLADQLFPEQAARYGDGPRAAEAAVNRAASMIREIVAEARESAVSEHVNRNAELAGAHREPGVGAGSGVETTQAGVYQPGQLADKYSSKANLLRG